jgi:hypothetical protein
MSNSPPPAPVLTDAEIQRECNHSISPVADLHRAHWYQCARNVERAVLAKVSPPTAPAITERIVREEFDGAYRQFEAEGGEVGRIEWTGSTLRPRDVHWHRIYIARCLTRLQLVPEASAVERERVAARWAFQHLYDPDAFEASLAERYPVIPQLSPPPAAREITLSTGTWAHTPDDPSYSWWRTGNVRAGFSRPICETPEDYAAVAAFLREAK